MAGLTDRIRDGAIETRWAHMVWRFISCWLTDRIRDGAIETIINPLHHAATERHTAYRSDSRWRD